jgi:hypothetical protein
MKRGENFPVSRRGLVIGQFVKILCSSPMSPIPAAIPHNRINGSTKEQSNQYQHNLKRPFSTHGALPLRRNHGRDGASSYCNFAYSALACFRIGMSGSASFHSVRKSL